MNVFSLISAKKSARSPAHETHRFGLERLEERQLMSVTSFALSNVSLSRYEVVDSGKITEQVADQQMGLPQLDSLPGAPRTLFLDFTGNFERDWQQTYNGQVDHYKNLSTPAYNTDSVAGTFNLAEQQEIRDVWAAVAEDFAPFNINVSTHYYGSFGDGQALKVAIGGDDNWLKRSEDKNISGTSDIRSYLTSSPNTVFVFSDNIGHNRLELLKIATTASHEAGHAFSLLHRSVWSADGTKMMSQYDPGTSEWTPIMGQNNSADRTTWSRGVTEAGPYTLQDDFAILGGLLGFRADEPSVTTLAGNATAAYTGPLSGAGIIHTTTDVDVFQFTTAGGQVSINVKATQIGSNLIPRAELWSASSLMVTGTFNSPTPSIADPKTSVISANLPAGTYFVRVKGGGDYGDMGQYTISVSTKPLAVATSGTTSPPVSGVVAATTNIATVDQTAASKSLAYAGASDGAPVTGNEAAPVQPKLSTSKARKVVSPDGRLQGDLCSAAVDAVFASFDGDHV